MTLYSKKISSTFQAKNSDILSNVYYTIETEIGNLKLDDNETFEVEIKFGKIKCKEYKKRIYLPILTPAIIEPSNNLFFEPDILLDFHKKANFELNSLYNFINKESQNISYSHKKILDSFYQIDGAKIRHSKTLDSDFCIIKKNLKNIEIYYPDCQFDIRLSLNIEITVDKNIILKKTIIHERLKDRISYLFPNFASIDLTQVTCKNEKIHELEIELESKFLNRENISELLIFVSWFQFLFNQI